MARLNIHPGDRFGMLTVISEHPQRTKKQLRQFNCKCDCGRDALVQGSLMKSGWTKSCGCLAGQEKSLAVEMIGFVKGRLTIVNAAPSSPAYPGQRMWLCACSCGGSVVIPTALIRRPSYQSCGCRMLENRRVQCTNQKTHGLGNTPEYNVWACMHRRCYNSNEQHYSRYGGRGIVVCPEWHDFKRFYADMGPRPSAEHTIERKANNGPYSPWNCVWATKTAQARNTRRNHLVTHNGETLCLAEWSERTGFKLHTILCRLRRGWSIEDALTKPLRSRAL